MIREFGSRDLESQRGSNNRRRVNFNDDPLCWWKLNDHKLPMLGQLARRYIAIQATGLPSERLFSKAGQVSTPARAQLKPEKVDQLMFLAENL